MLYYLFNYLDSLDISGAGLFEYISFRSGMALITSLIISIFFGNRLIGLLKKMQMGEQVRDLGLEGQKEKEGTPTMGGLIIIGAILIPTLLFAKLHNIYVITMIIATVWRSEEHTSELQSRPHLVCRLLLEKKNNQEVYYAITEIN